MDRYKSYKIAIWILSLIVIFEGIVIIKLIRPKKIPPKPSVAVPLPPPVPAIKGKIAIVIDDWGYNLNNLYIAEQINYPLTFSILPNLTYSSEIARVLHNRGFEIILHLPLESHEKSHWEHNTILTSFDEQTIRNILTQDLASIFYAKGVSSHMGSKATEDYRTMGIIFKELKDRHMYFLDSLVSSQSICSDLANKMQIEFVKRDIFLDNKEEPAYIMGQLYKLKRKAGIYGQAIGVGHDRKITLEVLKDALPNIEKEGYKFIFVSELAK